MHGQREGGKNQGAEEREGKHTLGVTFMNLPAINAEDTKRLPPKRKRISLKKKRTDLSAHKCGW